MSTDAFRAGTILGGVLLGLTLIMVIFRLIARYAQKARLQADDYFAILGWLCYLAFSVIHFIPVQSDLESEIKLDITADVIRSLALGLIKLSALFFFLRVLCVAGERSKFSITVRITAVVVGLWTVAYIILPPLQCGSHFSALWGPDDEYYKYCTVSRRYLNSQVVIDTVLEIFILLLPVPRILSLKTTRRRRFAIAAVFCIGVISVAASITALVVNYRASVEDYSASIGTVIDIEIGTTLIAVNTPSLVWLRHLKKPQHVLASICSALSLRSTSSRRSRMTAMQPVDDAASTFALEHIESAPRKTDTTNQIRDV